MPHVVIEEASDLGRACQSIQLASMRSGGEILKVIDVYLNRSGHTALVECVAQTVAAALGYRQRKAGRSGTANNGMLVAVSNFKIVSRPPLNQSLTIEVRELKRLGPMLMIAGRISCENTLIAQGELSLYA